MKILRNIVFFLLQITWCLFQNIAGALLFLCIPGRKPCLRYHRAFVRYWSLQYSMCMGLFVFLTGHHGRYARKEDMNRESFSILRHEYGHTRQSLLLGPFYFLLVALPSAIWCGLPWCKRYRQNKKIPYYHFYTESWANRLSDKYFKTRLQETAHGEK